MPVKNRALATLLAAVLLVTAAACGTPSIQQCQRYDGLSLSRENGFSSRLDWKDTRTVDLPTERIEVSLTAIRPMKGPVELVHLIGNVEADRWTLTIPNFNSSPTSICSIMPTGVPPSCGASLRNVPFSPGGYYYLSTGDNTVLEAGLSFYLCD